MPDEEFDVLGEDELALPTMRFERHPLELGEHEEEHEDMLLVRQARTLRPRLPREG
jgi:hypothetical protein